MSIGSASRSCLVACVGVVLLGGAAHAGKRVLDLDDTDFVFENTVAKSAAKAQGIGKVKLSDVQDLEMRLLPNDAWEVDVDDTLLLRGTYTRPEATAKRLTLAFDAASVSALENYYAHEIQAAAAAEGIGVTIGLTLVKATATVTIETNAKENTATAKLKEKFKFTGSHRHPAWVSTARPGGSRASSRA
jgi:hypothetical protein